MLPWLLFILAIYAPYLWWAQKVHSGWMNKDSKSTQASETNGTNVSILVPFRNEDGVVQELLNQLIQELPEDSLSEVILINDHSTDNGRTAVEKLLKELEPRIRLVENKGEGKKHALSTGIMEAKNDWIITLDADVKLPDRWYEFISKVCFNSKDDLLILPIEIHPTPKFFQKIEALEFTVLQGITFSYAQAGRAFLANGAHLAFKKQMFLDLDGYNSHIKVASGDDVFLLEQAQFSPHHSVGYSYYSDMSVATSPSNSISSLLSQKARWAKKTLLFKSNNVKLIGVLILTANTGLLVLLFSGNWRMLLLGFLIKSICDLYLVFFPLTTKGRKTLLKYIPVFMVVYPFYITFVSVATLILKPKWKGRSI